MNKLIDIEQFISEKVTERKQSLLHADLVQFDKQLNERINGKSVLVIGGAGTIGSSYIRAILKYKVAKLVVVDINENGLTELVRDVRSREELNVPNEFITYPINFGDPVFRKMFLQNAPFDIVANFAAHKHVRSEKDHFSIEAMVDNNVIKAKTLLDLLVEHPPERFFCVSTDKAANPVNVMGASKKLMEEVILAYSTKIPITTARFANVAFSNGSLPFGFIERLMKKQPLSSPLHIKRYFVSPEESGQICLLACILGESGTIFFPKLDPERDMKTFSTIAVELLAAMGCEPDYCTSEAEAKAKAKVLTENSASYPVYFFESDTSGEKPYEEFYTSQEDLDMDTFHQLGVIKNAKRSSMEEILPMFADLQQLFEKEDLNKSEVVTLMKKYLPNFEHIETGKSLDKRM